MINKPSKAFPGLVAILTIAAITISANTASAQFLSSIQASGTYATDFSSLTNAVNNGNLNVSAATPGTEAEGFVAASTPALNNQLVLGGIYDIIFIGEHAGWAYNDLDILFYNNANGTGLHATESVFENIAVPFSPAEGPGAFRRLVVNAASGLAGKYYDFALDSDDSSPGNGGVWSLFYPTNHVPTSTYDYAFTKTISSSMVFAYEDWNQNNTSDPNPDPSNPAPDFDRNDFVFAMNHTNVIPEPSTYALMVGGACLGFVVWKRRREKTISPNQ